MSKIPELDSVAELARFWDTHDLTEFEGELQEAVDPVFERTEQRIVRIRLRQEQASVLHQIARTKGVEDAELIETWINEKLGARHSQKR